MRSDGVEFDLATPLTNGSITLLVDKGDRGETSARAGLPVRLPPLSARPAGAEALFTRHQVAPTEILIMLFLNGHGVKPFEVREPLAREFARGRAKINAQARSVRFDQRRHTAQARGEPHSEPRAGRRPILAANIVLPGAQMIEVMRAARNPIRRVPSATPISHRLKLVPVAALQSLLGGLMAAGDDDEVGEAERLLRNASNSELEAARSTLLSIRQVFASAPIASSKVILVPFREAYLASFAQPEYVTVQLVNMLRSSALSAQLPFEELLRVYGFTME